MKHIKFLPALILSLFIASCSSISVSSDYESNVNYSGFKTYAFHEEGVKNSKINDIDKRRILKAIETQLDAKGLTLSNNPDLIVNFFTKENTDLNVYTYNNNYGWGWGAPGYPGYYGAWGYMGPWGPSISNTSVSTVQEGTLYIDIVDAKKKQLIWQGVGKGTINPTSNVEKREQKIQEFVTDILAQYPPKPGAKK
ncbi:DUF4136 domain-containing protein [Flavobacterium agricola]|uniref:DUF4136 domain-containing protein n=1 Tax=Flavobacterium agricola TaxID=2870839 RepID=A0ABY6LWM4_9FLAO|nr:DUF4136 domain-containing protein [Flavobacterium agricola]UYW00571.1 DUF4136 domain-containing protein [Flavobacterium agricola]